jgi:GT2 family glycosyltransferase
MTCVVGIATTGRPEIVASTVEWLVGLASPPERIVVCGAADGDVPTRLVSQFAPIVEYVTAEKGLTRQRNAIIDVCSAEDILVFLDDDFLIAEGFVESVVSLFANKPDIVLATGNVLADGINGPGLKFGDGRNLLLAKTYGRHCKLSEVYSGYGCNMAVRMSTVKDNGLSFDESLPLYGWLEDVDFSRRLARYGRIVRCPEMRGVHLGTKSGRTNGVRLGYSQIANPGYLMSKQSMNRPRAMAIMLRNLAANLVKSPFPEPWVDRRGRLKGNLLALYDLVLGRMHPEKVLSLP